MNTLKPLLDFFESHGGEAALVRDMNNSAETEDGSSVDPSDPDACRWCIYGATRRCPDWDKLLFEVYRRIDACSAIPGFSATEWLSDNNNWEAVQALLSRDDVATLVVESIDA